ncbi:MAG: hypothetical protein KTR31_29130 [Myxococcales bacterium]|nr:hypothetical protein [Myxococcales bacterium]
MERIEIPGGATYSPVALTDLMLGAPLASRVLLGATLPGQVASTALFALYLGSAAADWLARLGVRPIDFREEFDADVDQLEAMPLDAREWEVRLLARALNEDYTDERIERKQLARMVNDRLTEYVSGITGQQIVTSSEVRSFNFAKLVFPFAAGTCDVVSGDVAIFQDNGVWEPHVIAHEFCHRKGYLKELYAQVVAFLAMRSSGHPVLVQGARVERFHRQLAVLCGGDEVRYLELVETACLRKELDEPFRKMRPASGSESRVGSAMRSLYDQRMKMTGQNGLSDYDEGFTNFLWTFQRSSRARQPKAHAAV